MTAAAPAMIRVLVKYTAGAYNTQTVRGKRASSTCSAGEAMQRLARKLHGVEVTCTKVQDVRSAIELWRMPAVPPETAA